jgi:hypothetical protein
MKTIQIIENRIKNNASLMVNAEKHSATEAYKAVVTKKKELRNSGWDGRHKESYYLFKDEKVPLDLIYTRLWKELGGIVVTENEGLSEEWLQFGIGTDIHKVWQWMELEFKICIEYDIKHNKRPAEEGKYLLIKKDLGELGEAMAPIKAWIDNTDGVSLRVRVDHTYDIIIKCNESELSFKPTHSKSDDGLYDYIKFNEFEVHIKKEDEGLLVDVWDSPDKREVIDSMMIPWNNLIDGFEW